MSRRVAVVIALLVAAVIGLGTMPALDGRAIAAETCGSQPCTWNFNQARIPGAQPLGRAGAGVTVAVLDTWVDANHPELRGRVAGMAYCTSGQGACTDNSYRPDKCEHGTHVAGTVASTRYGVAPQARILAVQVLTYDPEARMCSGYANDVAAGIRFAVANGARVINLSLAGLVPGLFQSAQVTDAVRAAARAGVVVIFAAGNSTVPLTDDYGSDAVLVAATGPNGGLASYSSRGGSVSLAAPGGDTGTTGLSRCTTSTCILSTVPDYKYELLEGTSMAAPHVTGAAALLFAQDPGRSRGDVIGTLQRTARPLSGTRHGRLDAAAALQGRSSPTRSPGASSTGGTRTVPAPVAPSRPKAATPLPTVHPTTGQPTPQASSVTAISGHPPPGRSPETEVNLGWEPPSPEPGPGGVPGLAVGALLVLLAAVGVGTVRTVATPRDRAGPDGRGRDLP